MGIQKVLTGIMILSSLLFSGQLCDQVVDKKVIEICYNYKIKGPVYVKYQVDGNLVNVKNIKKRPRFYSERTIPARYRTKYSDYTHATFSKDETISVDRGHLAPDADFDYDKKVLRKVYTMANIVPQVSVFNQKIWTKPERYERKLATKYGKVKVITGLLYKDPDLYLVKKPLEMVDTTRWLKSRKIRYLKQAEALKRKHIWVPTHMWKNIKLPNGKEICFLYENKRYNPEKDRMGQHKIECSELHKIIKENYDFISEY